MIPKEVVTRLGNELLSIDFGVTPTMFDYCLMMAVLYFKECGCNVAVMETGLGGRLDSTNALGNPMVAVITRIGYDHMAILGNTLTEIASEKAGILKENVPAIFAPQDDEALAVLQKHPGTLVSSEDMEKVAFMKPGLMKMVRQRCLRHRNFSAGSVLMKRGQMLQSKQAFIRQSGRGAWKS